MCSTQQTCITSTDENRMDVKHMASDEKVVAALGRPFSLGMLYNVCQDKLRTGFTLWDKKTIEADKRSHTQNSCSFEITASDSIESKSSLLDVDVSLKASFLGGMVEVGGSAKYLNDQKKFKSQSRVTLQYKATTTFEQLSMTDVEAKSKINPAALEKESATHVVTSILYGANAFFVFDSDKLDDCKIENKMEAVIKKIPSFESKEKVCKNLTEEEKLMTDKFSCKFIGDFILPSNPSTFEEAVQTYIDLPKLLGQNRDIAVPLKVWLTPLKKFNCTAAELKGTISPELIRKAEKAVEGIRLTEMRLNESLENCVVENVPQISRKLNIFRKHLQDYKSWLQNKMSDNFISIRKGQHQHDTSLQKLLDDTEKSPFGYDNLKTWIKEKEREITAITTCVEEMKKAKMIANDSELKDEILASGVDHALCFVFTLKDSDDPYLDQMASYLDHNGPHCGAKVTPSTQELWCSKQVKDSMKQKAIAFGNLASNVKNNKFGFFIAAVPNEKYQGATIYYYKDDRLVTDDFSWPSIPDVKAVTNREDFIWYACDLTMDLQTANGYITLSEDKKKATSGDWQNYPDCPERFNKRPQVLCTQALTGRHYWEVEWSEGNSSNVGVGVTYKTIERKGNGYDSGLGSNKMSWYFELYGSLRAWHNGHVWSGDVPPSGCSKVGVYLDHPAGTLSFYDASSDTLSHIYTFTTKFSQPVYPGFFLYYKTNYARLCPV